MSRDVYSRFTELEKAESGDSFSIKCEYRNSVYAVMAPHGGKIESGTTEISVAIALNDLSLYLFEGKKANNNRMLHITSSNFDEPQCMELLDKVETVLSIHGARDPDLGIRERVWVGGSLHEEFRRNLEEKLKTLEILVEFNPNFSGKNTDNICNRGISKEGMQLEITKSLRDKLIQDKILLKQFSNSVRMAMMLTYPID
ncbi:poly-gamma-glutamate hydrolase family protein [Proteus terrae]|uniref:poly-gamma-glutamate hydrolase family protein n=1 Tax=Proteus TaxID=583 RepID=UPI00217E0AA1|nr:MULTISPECIES: poly-gamma-glutamate hydrolase family protein [Proteus]MCS6715238.1 poly-gamma-glutamate hydrolase family protein [Proteus terrae]MCS6734134.1 poly-gamma-glutamate hydrolase family protein [Proteus terrae]